MKEFTQENKKIMESKCNDILKSMWEASQNTNMNHYQIKKLYNEYTENCSDVLFRNLFKNYQQDK